MSSATLKIFEPKKQFYSPVLDESYQVQQSEPILGGGCESTIWVEQI